MMRMEESEASEGRSCSPSTTLSRGLSMVAGFLSTLVTAPLIGFNIYMNAMREQYQLPLTQVEWMSSLAYVALYLCVPVVYIYNRVGGRWCHLIGTILTVVAYTMMWNSTYHVDYYSLNCHWLDLYYFIAGAGGCFHFTTSLLTNLPNFRRKYKGKILATLLLPFEVGPFILAIIYGAVFTSGSPEDYGVHNLRSMFLLLLVVSVLFGLLGVLFCADCPPTDSLDEELHLMRVLSRDSSNSGLRLTSVQDESLTDSGIQADRSPSGPSNFWRQIDFYLGLCAFVLLISGGFTLYNNISVYLKVIDAPRFVVSCTIISPAVIMMSKLLAGVFSDAFLPNTPRFTAALVANIPQGVVFFFLIFIGDKILIVLLTFMFVFMGYGATWCILPMAIPALFEEEMFGKIFACLLTCQSVTTLIFQMSVGLLYETNLRETQDCHGLKCFQFSFILIGVICLTGLVLNVILAWRHRNAIVTRTDQRLDYTENLGTLFTTST